MLERVFKVFDRLWDALDEDLAEMDADNKRRMESLIDAADKVSPGTSETTTEVETRPDGTVIKRTRTVTRSR